MEKKNNDPVIGWVCSYVPEEILYAAGIKSYRIVGDYSSESKTNTYIPSNYCSFVVNTVEAAMEGKYKFLDGLIMTNSCLACELMHDVWKREIDNLMVYQLDVPRINSSGAAIYFKDRLIKLIENIENHFNVKITDQSLFESVKIHNEIRKLLSSIQSLRKNKNPPLSGLDFLNICNMNYSMSKDEYIKYLMKLLKLLKIKETKVHKKKRIFLMGSKIFHKYVPEIVEDEGGLVVYESMCSSNKNFDNLVEIKDDLLLSISERYINKTPCSRMHDKGDLIKSVKKEIDDYNIDGVIYYSTKYCSSNALKGVEIKEQLKNEEYPVLFIEDDYSKNSLEQVRTRVNTFIELL